MDYQFRAGGSGLACVTYQNATPTLRESRSATQRQRPEDLRSQLAPSIADAVIDLIRICDAAYYTEFVEIDRVLGDPVSKWTDSIEAMQEIRDIVDRDWNERERKTGNFSIKGICVHCSCMPLNVTKSSKGNRKDCSHKKSGLSK